MDKEKTRLPLEKRPADPPRLPAGRVNRALLSHIRHELCTPLNAIIGYSEMLQEDGECPQPKKLLPDLRKTRDAGKRLLKLVNDLLDPVRLEADQPELDLPGLRACIRRELRAPIDGIVDHSEMLLEDAADLGQPDLIADLQKIHQAALRFSALLDDIVKFSTAEAGQVDLDLKTSAASSLAQDAVAAVRPLDPDGGDAPGAKSGRVLVVEDEPNNRDLLSRRLAQQGYTVVTAENGRQALETLGAQSFDLVLLDIMMPEMNGYQVLRRIKSDPARRDIPVIMISALDDIDSVVRCVEIGADDYLAKPFNPVLLKARVGACLEKKRLRDQERAYLMEIQAERAKSERLLLNVLPKAVGERLKNGEKTIVDAVSDATVIFADIVNFTRIAADLPPARIVALLNDLFSEFDILAESMGVEKIKTIGDAYMAVGGVPLPVADHAVRCGDMALGMLKAVEAFNDRTGQRWQIRIGMHTGPLVAGIIGAKKFAYDLWGDTVNIASRLESHGEADAVQVSQATAIRLSRDFILEKRGAVKLKNRGAMMTYRLIGRRPPLELPPST